MSLARRAVIRLAMALSVVALATPAPAQIELDITEGVVEPLPIAVSEFYGASAEEQRLGSAIADVVAADLERSGLFRPLDRRAFIQSPEQLRTLPRFADWRQINAQALVTGQVQASGDGLVVEFRLWDVFAGVQMRGLRLQTSEDQWRRIAHKVADAVYERLTGESGYFDTRIAYIAETGAATDRIKRIAVMDQDGENHRYLSDGGDLVLTPRFDPSVTSLAYLRYAGTVPQVQLMDLRTGQERVLGQFDDMTFAPHFSPGGQTVALTVAAAGNSEIHLLDLASGRQTRITNHPAIDTSSSFSPDGGQIVFNSDRAGTPQLYVMSARGGEPRRISFGGGQYGSPAWSPRGDLIAFTKIDGGFFHIGVMRPDGSNERLLTRSAFDEGPTFAPNGRVILFSRKDPRTGRSRLMSIDVTGYNERLVPTPTDASDPDWSNIIP
ncbi:MAG TPA: Tol-Pal system beta propeller repeat protein TolB [Geminicoccaceae bacterium]